MRKTFEEALGDLLAEYADITHEERISALELAIMAAREEESAEADDE
jgi:hypothetical protein